MEAFGLLRDLATLRQKIVAARELDNTVDELKNFIDYIDDITKRMPVQVRKNEGERLHEVVQRAAKKNEDLTIKAKNSAVNPAKAFQQVAKRVFADEHIEDIRELREEIEQHVAACILVLVGEIHQGVNTVNDKIDDIRNRVDDVHAALNANDVFLIRKEKNVVNFSEKYNAFKAESSKLFKELFPEERLDGVEFPLEIARRAEHAFLTKENKSLMDQIDMTRNAGQAFANLLNEEFCMSINDYMEKQGFSEAVNVLKVAAALDAVNYKKIKKALALWSFDSFTHVLAISAMSNHTIFAILMKWVPSTPDSKDPFPTDFMNELREDISKNVASIEPPPGFQIDRLRTLHNTWNNNVTVFFLKLL